MDEEYFLRNIVGKSDIDGLFAAHNQNGKAVGFIHCCCCSCGNSIEALFFLPGKIHECVGKMLTAIAKEYFEAKNESRIKILSGCIDYPFYSDIKTDIKKEFQSKPGHIYERLEDYIR